MTAGKVSIKYIVGIDEAGRGPLAGPVSVAGFFCEAVGTGMTIGGDIKFKDSKKFNQKNREKAYEALEKNFAVSLVSHTHIDKFGIASATVKGVENVLADLEKNFGITHENCFIILDGSLKAPKQYKQKTVTKGDEKVEVVANASIFAKVTRDRYMLELHKKHPQYEFDKHKGYGTKLHYEKIKKHGLSEAHRKSFTRGVKIDKI